MKRQPIDTAEFYRCPICGSSEFLQQAEDRAIADLHKARCAWCREPVLDPTVTWIELPRKQ